MPKTITTIRELLDNLGEVNKCRHDRKALEVDSACRARAQALTSTKLKFLDSELRETLNPDWIAAVQTNKGEIRIPTLADWDEVARILALVARSCARNRNQRDR